jgi:hypothetical protein
MKGKAVFFEKNEQETFAHWGLRTAPDANL